MCGKQTQNNLLLKFFLVLILKIELYFQFGYANVSLGCEPCNCNTNGSIQTFCDTHTGQCPCKMGVEGLKCDECSDGFFGLLDGCQGKYKNYDFFSKIKYFISIFLINKKSLASIICQEILIKTY